jgi:copper homeostasis protein CutC
MATLNLTARALSAARGGADRLEVCGNLGIGGGTTPSLGLVRAIQKATPNLEIMVGPSFISATGPRDLDTSTSPSIQRS